MAAVAYYLFVYPISLLPLRVIYYLSDVLFLLLLTVFPYRKKVIDNNLKNSFPEKSPQEIKKLRRQFYRHFADLLAESIKNLSMSETELRKRITVENPEIMEELYTKNKSVLLVSGHYNNWEWVISSLNLLFPHQAVGIGMPLSQKFWDEKVNTQRARFGIIITHAKEVKTVFKLLENKLINTLILSDQSPVDATKSYWTNFLNQQTAVLFGCELMAHQYNHAVVFYRLEKVKRGYYSMKLEVITEEPQTCKWGEITEKHVQLLEKAIVAKPAFWLWSHKRWKRAVPENLDELRAEQRKRFEGRF
ncbi:MAG TPA: lysophospholipid acyltransferase family protein [Crocinitomicaceae bacterium]|nr:lysophospholipid acyltransferase family protein [Crocinitomicaceae bacterium]